MNLKTFQQSELKRFEKKLDIRNDCSNVKDIHMEDCQGCVLIAVEEVDYLKVYLSSSIEKAFALGKEEVLERVKLETDACVCECGEKWSETDLADYVNKELNLPTKVSDEGYKLLSREIWKRNHQ